MSSGRVFFVARRWEAIAALLLGRGYAIDPGARDPNEWHELAKEEPPTGVVRLKGVRLADPQAADSSFDPGVSFSVEELWAVEYVEGAYQEHGYYLVSYSYHGHDHDADLRFDFDPWHHPEQPYHRHPPGSPQERQPTRLVSPEEALDHFERWRVSRHG